MLLFVFSSRGFPRFLPPLALALAFAILPASLNADTHPFSRKPNVGGCYCGCTSKSGKMSACTKMCDLPRYAARWWATTCAKPHMQPAPENHDAGPRYSHPGRAERASR